jgi:hypothetical protein
MAAPLKLRCAGASQFADCLLALRHRIEIAQARPPYRHMPRMRAPTSTRTPSLAGGTAAPGAAIGHAAAIEDVEHEDRFPFLTLGGMDRREDQIILVEQRHACLVARRVRRIERKFR